MKNTDVIVIKQVGVLALPKVQFNEIFQQLTAALTVLNCNVNGQRCIVVAFDSEEDPRISRLEKFCEKVLLEFCTLPVPWGNGRTLALIRPVGFWVPRCLGNVRSVDELL